jgi:sugar lactone lactonase YvrE
MTKDRLSGRRDLRGLAALLCVVSTSAMASEWIRQLGTAKDDYANAVATDADRNVYVAGSSGLRTGAEDAWLTKLGPGGRVHWKRQLRTSETDRATGVATDADGKVYVAGWTTGSLGGPISGIADAWLAKYDDAGNMLWIRACRVGIIRLSR